MYVQKEVQLWTLELKQSKEYLLNFELYLVFFSWGDNKYWSFYYVGNKQKKCVGVKSLKLELLKPCFLIPTLHCRNLSSVSGQFKCDRIIYFIYT